ncbi:MAG TPA: hypothetical protein VMN36_01845 [Verrucomicrobiales bacterium]|nr:hypothetical protein [Verrucomicrobiales bacterium]
MASPMGYEAAAAVYHVMPSGDGWKYVFEDDVDRKVCCSSHFSWFFVAACPPYSRRRRRKLLGAVRAA